MRMSGKNEDNIEILKGHIEELYRRVAMLSQHNVDTYLEDLNKFDGYTIYRESCSSSQWNIYTSNSFSEIDVSVYVSTGGYNQYKQMPAVVTINGGHIQIDFDMPYTGYVMYKETGQSSSSQLTHPQVFYEEVLVLKIDEDYEVGTIHDLNLTDISLVEEPTDSNCIVNKEPF